MTMRVATMQSTVSATPQINNSLNGGQGVVSRSSVASSSAFLGCKQKASSSSSSGSFLGTTVAVNGNNKSRIVCEAAKSGEDRWKGLGYDISDDQQDIQRGKGMVDSLFQGATGVGTQTAIMSSYDYISTAQRT
jgi:hypothetical protein